MLRIPVLVVVAHYVVHLNMSKIISYNSNIPAENYERIFGNGKKKKEVPIVYNRNPSGEKIVQQPNIILVDDDGKKINKVNTYHKNKIYRQAKQLREVLRDTLPTKSEHWNPSEKNVQKVLHQELRNPQIQSFKMAMQAIGADPKDYNIEKIRKGR